MGTHNLKYEPLYFDIGWLQGEFGKIPNTPIVFIMEIVQQKLYHCTWIFKIDFFYWDLKSKIAATARHSFNIGLFYLNWCKVNLCVAKCNLDKNNDISSCFIKQAGDSADDELEEVKSDIEQLKSDLHKALLSQEKYLVCIYILFFLIIWRPFQK